MIGAIRKGLSTSMRSLGKLFLRAGDFTRPYEGATTGRRGRLWIPSAMSGTQAIVNDGNLMRNRAHHLARNNPWAKSAIEVWKSECIGTGVRPRFGTDDPKLRKTIQDLWNISINEMDSDGILDYYGMQAQVIGSIIESGEQFIRFRPRLAREGLAVPLQLQLIDADQVPLNKSGPGNGKNRIIAGVELDIIGKRVAYHVLRKHPGDPTAAFDGVTTVRVPADQVIHVYRPWRPGDMRGATWFSSILVKLFDLDQYDDAELMRKKTAALLTGFIIPGDKSDPPLLNVDDDLDDEDDSGADRDVRLEAGTMQVLETGDDIKMAEPADVSGSYQVFMDIQLHAVSIGFGVPFEALTGDLSKVNFSSIRAGMITFRRRCLQFQKQILNYQMNRRVIAEWLKVAVIAGKLPSMSVKELNDIVCKTRWVGQGFEYIQPVQEQEAHARAVRSGFMSRSQVATERGFDPEDLENEIEQDNKRADKLGLIFDSDPRKVARSGTAQPDGILMSELNSENRRAND